MMAYRPATNIAVLDCEVSEIRLLLERYAGVLIEMSSEALAESIARHVAVRQMNSASELLSRLEAAPSESHRLLESLLAGDTAFFRWPAVFDAFEGHILSQIKERKRTQEPRWLRLWSAGCSTGEEAYSIAISVCESLRQESAWNIHVVASDIRDQALTAAERGVYDSVALQNVPRQLVAKYFSRIGESFLAKPRLRNMVSFTRSNLAGAGFMGRFDCIFCMDVLPHFSSAQRSALIERLRIYLEPGGYLFLGENEKLALADNGLIPHSHLTSIYYQRPMAVAAGSGKD